MDSAWGARQNEGLLLKICDRSNVAIEEYTSHGALDWFKHASIRCVTKGINI